MVDVAPQIGVRQTRLLEGEYVVTKDDVHDRARTSPTPWRAAATTTTPYRSLLPRRVDELLVAGRHYSATPEAQKMSREIPPCMAMGEAAGVAAALALCRGHRRRATSTSPRSSGRLRAQGADPGDVPSANALVDAGDRPIPARPEAPA